MMSPLLSLTLLLLPSIALAQDCTPPSTPSNGRLVESSWVQGAVAIRCDYGKVPSGRGLAMCVDGAWTEELECEDGVALVVGGDLEEGYTNHAELYSPSGDCQVEIPALPHAARGGFGGWVGGAAVVCGGEPQMFSMNQECFAYSPATNTWEEAPSLPWARSMSSAVVTDGVLMMSGGYDEEYYTQLDAAVLLPKFENGSMFSDWSSVAPLPHGRSDHCSVALPGDEATSKQSILVTGTYPESKHDNMAETSLLEIVGAISNWTPLSNMTTGRDEHGCCLVEVEGELQVLVAGGPRTGKAERYSITEDTWYDVASLPHTRFGPNMVVLEGRPTLMGGWEYEAAHHDQATVYQYIALDDSWVEVAQLEVPRSHSTAIVVPKSKFSCK